MISQKPESVYFIFLWFTFRWLWQKRRPALYWRGRLSTPHWLSFAFNWKEHLREILRPYSNPCNASELTTVVYHFANCDLKLCVTAPGSTVGTLAFSHSLATPNRTLSSNCLLQSCGFGTTACRPIHRCISRSYYIHCRLNPHSVSPQRAEKCSRVCNVAACTRDQQALRVHV